MQSSRLTGDMARYMPVPNRCQTAGLCSGLYAITFFLPTIIAGFEQQFHTRHTVLQQGLIVAIPFTFGGLAMYFLDSQQCSAVDETGVIANTVDCRVVAASATPPRNDTPPRNGLAMNGKNECPGFASGWECINTAEDRGQSDVFLRPAQ